MRKIVQCPCGAYLTIAPKESFWCKCGNLFNADPNMSVETEKAHQQFNIKVKFDDGLPEQAIFVVFAQTLQEASALVRGRLGSDTCKLVYAGRRDSPRRVL